MELLPLLHENIGKCKRSPPPWVPVPGVSGTSRSSTMNVHSAADGRDHPFCALWVLAGEMSRCGRRRTVFVLRPAALHGVFLLWKRAALTTIARVVLAHAKWPMYQWQAQ